MSKIKIIVIGASVLVVSLLIFAGYKLYVGVTAFSEAEKTLQTSITRLNRYYAAKPFPSKDNIDKEAANLKTLNDWFYTLVEGIRKGQIQDNQEKRPSKFIDMLSEKQNEIKMLANNARPTVALLDDFALGFERYSAGDLPDPQYVPRLTQQLIIMDTLCRILIDSGVQEIIKVQRETIELSETGVSAKYARTDKQSGKKTTKSSLADEFKGNSVNIAAGTIQPGELFTKFSFRYLIKIDETSLVTLLNRIAASPLFAVTTGILIQKDENDVVLPEGKSDAEDTIHGKKAKGAVSSGKTAADILAGLSSEPSAVDVASNPEPSETKVADETLEQPVKRLSRKQRMVSGGPFEKPIDVLIDIDVYRFAEVEVAK